jgi:HCOMODA/2-hydroxy-3-carboxy-muconic semialdehyde decarboxylase
MKIKIAAACAAFLLTLWLSFSAAKSPAQVVVATSRDQAVDDLVYANHILYNEGVLDAFGHISVRDPQDPARFYLSRNLAPSQVTRRDILQYDDVQCNTTAGAAGSYLERFIHCAIYRARPDVNAVIHGHSPSLISFGATRASLRPLFGLAGWMGTAGVPTFDIRSVAGDSDLLISNNMLADALARSLGDRPMVLMRGHGETIVGASISQTVVHAYYAVLNAQVQTDAMRLGSVTYLTPGEAAAAAKTNDNAAIGRAWEMFKVRAGKIE